MNNKITEENVIVAVRVRPFNKRELKRNAECIIDMPNLNETIIRNSKDKKDEKKFQFDYSYWSFDDFYVDKNGVNIGNSSKYIDQKRIFNDLGKIVLNNAWKGFNVSLFSYGQTGSGKSYSIVGFQSNKGLVPKICEELFRTISEKKEKKYEYQICISMFEIYCEKIRDLLVTESIKKNNLKVREHPKTGFYIENLLSIDVKSFNDIEKQIDIGTKNRSIASTSMNITSSRGHTIIRLNFKQKIPKKSGNGTTTKTSEINLVDLAGSERQKDAEVEGQRLKEGIVINKSLTTLGRVIKTIVDIQQWKGKNKSNIQIPYRDSILTCVLKNALGGNSKTIMIAAISPADLNYDETLSTLRFADRVKNIKTKAIVNESVTEKLIRELMDENIRLKELIDKGVSIDGKVATDDEVEELKRLLESNKIEMENLKKKWEEKFNLTEKNFINYNENIIKKRKEIPHLWNLNEDPALTNKIIHFINKNDTLVTNQTNITCKNKIILEGLSIMENHATIFNKNDKKIFIKPNDCKRILINGQIIYEETELKQNDVILFGGNHMYVFQNPKKEGMLNINEITYDMALIDIAKTGEFGNQLNGIGIKSNELPELEEDLIALIPTIDKANLMCNELKIDIVYSIILATPESRGLLKGSDQVLVKATFKKEDVFFVWPKDKFLTRYYDIEEIYQDFIENKKININKNSWDYPFFESLKSEVYIGTCYVSLKSLAKLIDISNDIPVIDFNGEQVGLLTVSLIPCQLSGKEIVGEFVEKSEEIIGKNIGYKIKILTVNSLSKRYEKCWCSYKFFEENLEKTITGIGNNIVFAHEKVFYYKPVSKKLLEYLERKALIINVHGYQKTRYKNNLVDDVTIKINKIFGDPIEKKVEELKVSSQQLKENESQIVPEKKNPVKKKIIDSKVKNIQKKNPIEKKKLNVKKKTSLNKKQTKFVKS
uniref:Kinesin-like protein n=1 Tax=Strongyloides stercoralis TaxID=6248 RepID=A0A0K0ED16_STRER